MSPMKNVPILALFSAGFALAGCSGSSDTSSAPTPPSSAATQQLTSTQIAPAALSLVQAHSVKSQTLEAATMLQQGHCSLDNVEGADLVGVGSTAVYKIAAGKTFTAAGWALDQDLKAPQKISLVFKGDNAIGFGGTTGVSRPDVSTATHSSSTSSGFIIKGSLASVPSATYEVLVLAKVGSGDQSCDTGRTLVVGQ